MAAAAPCGTEIPNTPRRVLPPRDRSACAAWRRPSITGTKTRTRLRRPRRSKERRYPSLGRRAGRPPCAPGLKAASRVTEPRRPSSSAGMIGRGSADDASAGSLRNLPLWFVMGMIKGMAPPAYAVLDRCSRPEQQVGLTATLKAFRSRRTCTMLPASNGPWGLQIRVRR